MVLKRIWLIIKKMASKYEKEIFELLNFSEIKSTNEILKIIQKRHKKVINWYLIHRCLKDLESRGDAELVKSSWGLFWKRKK